MKHLCIGVTIAASLITGNALAQAKPEDAIKYRRGVFAVMGWNFGALAAMAKGERPHDKDEAARRAATVAFMSRLPAEGFVPGSDKGDTKAKPEVWSEMDDFKAKLEKMQAEAAKLADVAKGGDLNALKAQVGETGKACKACHDKFRNK